MTKKNTLFISKNVKAFLFLCISLFVVSEAFTQDCFTLYGPTGVPSQGLISKLCQPTPGVVTLDATAATANGYSWVTGALTSSIITAVPNTYTVWVSSGSNPNACILDFVVTAYPNPTPQILGDTTFCAGDSTVLTVTPRFDAYLWSDGVTTNDSITVNTAGTYGVVVRDTNNCYGVDSVVVIQNALPVPNLGTSGIACTGDSIIIDAGAGYTSYAWNTGDTNQTISAGIVATYTVTVEDTNTCVGSDQFIFTNHPIPVVNIGADDSLCIGSSKTLNAGAGFNSYLWSDATTLQTATFSVTSDPWVIVTDANNCRGTDSMHLEIYNLPHLDLGPDDTVCASSPFFLNAGNPGNSIASYLWSNASTLQTINIPANPALTSDLGVDYAVTITDVNGCINSDTMNLETWVIPIPDLGNDTSYCIGDAFSMVLDPGSFNSYAWSTGVSSPTITIGPVSRSYIVTVTDARGCTNTDDIFITQHSLPYPNIGPDDSYCEGANYTKVLNPGIFSSYLWTDGTTGQVLGISLLGTYGVTVTDLNGCMNSDDIVITENPSPKVDLGVDIVYCEDDTVREILDATTLLVGGGANHNFNWNTNERTGIITATKFGTFSVLVTDKITNCFATGTMKVVPMEKAAPDLGEDGVVCQGQLITLDPKVTISGYNYVWSNGATTTTTNVFETGLYWVRLDAADGTCVGLTDSVYFSPGVLPVVELGGDQYVCEGQRVTLLNASTPFPDATYVWQDGFIGKSYTATETGDYEVEVFNECGSVVDQVYIEFQDCSNVWFPNSFTPNGDGRNDVFYPKTEQEFVEYGFWIYDRSGTIVFKTNTPNYGWDGKINGEDAAIGGYVWRISYVSSFQKFGERVEKVGEFTLIR
jgi:gliding motility-associated-like protein